MAKCLVSKQNNKQKDHQQSNPRPSVQNKFKIINKQIESIINTKRPPIHRLNKNS